MTPSHLRIRYRYLLLYLTPLLLLVGCVRAAFDYSTNKSDQPRLSVDTIRVDTLYSTLSSATYVAMIHNPHSKALLLDKVSLLSGGSKGYRINVDGRSGNSAEALTIAARDSMYVFVEASFAEGKSDLPTLVTDSLVIVCNGVTHYTRIEGVRQNVTILPSDYRITEDTHWSATRPYLLRDSITISPNATLHIAAGSHILMPIGGKIIVQGRINMEGTSDHKILIEGIRRDGLTTTVSYRLIPNQWDGIYFTSESRDNIIRHTVIRNGSNGIVFAPTQDLHTPRLLMESGVVTNMGGRGVSLLGGKHTLRNSELSNTRSAALFIENATVLGQHLTIASDYLFEHRLQPALYIGTGASLQLSNSIVDGTQTLTIERDTLLQCGEIAAKPSTLPNVKIEQSYLRLANDEHVAQRILDQHFPTSRRASVPFRESYLLMGKDQSQPKAPHHFLYDYRPLDSLDIRQTSSLIIPECTTDLLGLPRQTNSRGGYTVGAYEAVSRSSVSVAPWWSHLFR